MALVLYQRDDCHLCDQAVEVLAQARAHHKRTRAPHRRR
ncbi:glutaredoxin family protein [Xanthomonas arboricola]